MPKPHEYQITTTWDGGAGGTSAYTVYSRDHEIAGGGKLAAIPASSDPAFRGNAARYNPEELLVAALSSCHMLWVLHLCAEAGIVVTAYRDDAIGRMTEQADGSGRFTEVRLRPRVALADPARSSELDALHRRAHELCFIANSVNFPVYCEPSAYG